MIVISRAAAKEKYDIDIGDGAFLFMTADSNTRIVFRFDKFKELMGDMSKEQQQELYEYLYTLGCKINR